MMADWEERGSEREAQLQTATEKLIGRSPTRGSAAKLWRSVRGAGKERKSFAVSFPPL